MRAACALVDDTQQLVSGAGIDENHLQLADSTRAAVANITKLADVVKRSAAAIGPGHPDMQVRLDPLCYFR
ncbi:unnamed protein product [Protopolystoma xenopodis]|uniref:Uncharacterized protein n=1 Tax=Protopolystoma xenopodis TaxID=117903 RepID=A0A448X6Z0_9PLAT|nr:unnamed protein product [Protopolystoma xenopodis]